MKPSVVAETGPTTAASDLKHLAERVRRLAPSHHDPEKVHMDKSEIAGELRRIAKEIAV